MKNSGQTLIEFLLILPVSAAAISGAFWMLYATALRTSCAESVFRAVRSSAHGERSISEKGVHLRANTEGVEGWKKCGSHVERLFLPYLGHRSPGS